jgi:cell division protein FtsQ
MILGLLGFLYGFSIQRNQEKNITEIEVQFIENQASFLTIEKVNKLLIQSETNLLNKPKSLINLHQLEEEVRNNKMVENAEVYITPRGKLRANIIQRVPLVRIQNGAKSYYLDRQGLPMPLSPNYSIRVPLVTGVVNTKMEAEVHELVEVINNNEFYKKQIIGIHRKINGDYLLSTRIGRHKILLGNLNDVENKLKKLQVFYKKEWDSENLRKYKLINLKFNHQVVCSK